MKRAFEVLWIVNYIQDIRADFFAIYHIPDWEALDGPLFVSLAERLPMYEGALQGRIKLENATEEDSMVESTGNYRSEPGEFTPGQVLTLSEALSGDAQLMAMQEESIQQGWGNLFDMATG
jgi:hypothetical protein